MDKFNHFAKAQNEVKEVKSASPGMPTKRKKETKKQMSIMLTPSQKEKLRKLADEADMSASELIGYWIDQN